MSITIPDEYESTFMDSTIRRMKVYNPNGADYCDFCCNYEHQGIIIHSKDCLGKLIIELAIEQSKKPI